MPTKVCSANLGRDARLYRNTGTIASPTWVEVKEMRDITMGLTADKVEQSDRSTRFKLYDAGGIELSITGQMTYRNNNANCNAFRELILDNCAEHMALVDGDITVAGTQGIRGGFKVFNLTHNLPLTDGMTVELELAPCFYLDGSTQIVPAWFTVPSPP